MNASKWSRAVRQPNGGMNTSIDGKVVSPIYGTKNIKPGFGTDTLEPLDILDSNSTSTDKDVIIKSLTD